MHGVSDSDLRGKKNVLKHACLKQKSGLEKLSGSLTTCGIIVLDVADWLIDIGVTAVVSSCQLHRPCMLKSQDHYSICHHNTMMDMS